jgi:hypothetical protein
MANGVLPPDNDDHFNNIYNNDANSYCPNGNPLIEFSGYKWWINYHWSQETGTYVWGDGGTFNSIFNPKIIEQDGNNVRLWVSNPTSPGQAWQTSEIVLVDKLGYGRYLVTAWADGGSFSDLDPNAVFGMFTYQYSEAPRDQGENIHREIDLLEVLRGGSSNAQFTLQPWSHVPTPWDPFTIPPNTPCITAMLSWEAHENGVVVSTTMHLYLGDYSLETLPPLESAWRIWRPAQQGFGALVPRHTDASCERFHINLWLMKGNAPAREQSVTLTRFQFQAIPPD